MKIIPVLAENIQEYHRFYKTRYHNHPLFRDSITPSLKRILARKAEICKSAILKPILINDGDRTVAVATLAIVDRMNDTVQIAYFEALDDQQRAVDLLMETARTMAAEHGAVKIIAGLNFHVNYGLGLLTDSFDKPHSFGSSYNPPSYSDYFKKYGGRKITLHSYRKSINDFTFPEVALTKRVARQFSVRASSFSRMADEIAVYVRLNNEIFKNHDYYYERKFAEDFELFREFKPFLRHENLLFLEHKQKTIGFMLWYPDFSQLMATNETIGLGTLIKYKLFHKKIDTFKIVEIGVLPEYQNSGAVFALFMDCLSRTKGRFTYCETGWILDHNYASKAFSDRWNSAPYKAYEVFSFNA